MEKKIERALGDKLIVRHEDGTEEELNYAICFQFDKFVEGDISAKETTLSVHVIAHGETYVPALLMYNKVDEIWDDLGRTLVKEDLRELLERLADEDL